MKRYFKLYKSYLAMAIKSRLIYRADAIIGIFSFVFTNAVNLISVFIMVSFVDYLLDYSFANLMFLYGIILMPMSIDHIFTDNIWAVGFDLVRKGDVDKYLVKPLNPLFQIIAELFQPEGFGELILGIALLCIYAPQQSISWSFFDVSGLVVSCFFGIFIFTAVKLITASIAFWTKQSGHVMWGAYYMHSFARYPVEIFGRVLKTVLVTILPFSLILFLPVDYLLSGRGIWYAVPPAALASVLSLIVAYFVFRVGLRRYESAGS